MSVETVDCRRFEELFSDYLEKTLSLPLRAGMEAHVASCARCSMLLADVRSLVERAGSLPQLEPSRDLWPAIAERVDTPVMPLAAAQARRRLRIPRWTLLAAAAAVLVVVTSLVTREWTRSEPAARRELVSAPAAQPGGTPSLGSESTAVAGESVRVVSAENPTLRNAAARERASAAEVYRREIAALEEIVSQRDTLLDPATTAIIQNSLRIIDSAIMEARAALARDPASRFLRDQVDRSLHKKMELLRSVAILASRTS